MIHWTGRVAIESRIASDLPWEALKEVVTLATEIHGEESVFDTICSSLGANRAAVGTNIDDWLQNSFSEEQIRNAIGVSAKTKGWFKRTDYGQKLGRIVAKALPSIPNKDLTLKVNQLGEWIYG